MTLTELMDTFLIIFKKIKAEIVLSLTTCWWTYMQFSARNLTHKISLTHPEGYLSVMAREDLGAGTVIFL